MAASKTIKKAPPKKAPTKPAAPKKAAAKKAAPKKIKKKSTPKATAPDTPVEPLVARKQTLRVAEEDPVTTELPAVEDPIIEEEVQVQAQPVAYRPGRGGAIRIEPKQEPVPETLPQPIASADIPEAENAPVLPPVEAPIIPPVEQVEAIEPVAAIPEISIAAPPIAEIPFEEKKVKEIPMEETPVEEKHEVLEEFKKVELKVTDVIKALWQRIKNWKYLKWVAIGLAIFAVIYLIDTIRLIKRNHDIKQTKKIEAKIEQKEERLNLTDSGIVEMQRQGDSLREVSDNELQKATDHLKASQEANQKRVNLIKMQRYEIDNKIKSLNNNDVRRNTGSQLAKPE